MQSGISRDFSVEALRSLAQLYTDNGFLTHDEADAFLSDIPVPGERDEPQSTVADYMLSDNSGQFDGLTTSAPTLILIQLLVHLLTLKQGHTGGLKVSSQQVNRSELSYLDQQVVENPVSS